MDEIVWGKRENEGGELDGECHKYYMQLEGEDTEGKGIEGKE